MLVNVKIDIKNGVSLHGVSPTFHGGPYKFSWEIVFGCFGAPDPWAIHAKNLGCLGIS